MQVLESHVQNVSFYPKNGKLLPNFKHQFVFSGPLERCKNGYRGKQQLQ